MNVEIFYLALPLAYALYAIERVGVLRRLRACGQSGREADSIAGNNVSPLFAALVSLEELAFVLLSVVAFLAGMIWPLLALFYGHAGRAYGRSIASLRRRKYTPGLFSLALLAPYWVVGVWNMSVRFPFLVNLGLMVGGVLFVGLNSMLLRRLYEKKQAGKKRG